MVGFAWVRSRAAEARKDTKAFPTWPRVSFVCAAAEDDPVRSFRYNRCHSLDKDKDKGNALK